MKNISLWSVEATVHITTDHNSSLESVLTKASDRTGVDYYDELAGIITHAFNFTPYKFIEYGAYGDVWLVISVPEVHELESALAIVDTAVAQWRNKFNINRMKPFRD